MNMESIAKAIETGVDLAMRRDAKRNLFGPQVILQRKHFNPGDCIPPRRSDTPRLPMTRSED